MVVKTLKKIVKRIPFSWKIYELMLILWDIVCRLISGRPKRFCPVCQKSSVYFFPLIINGKTLDKRCLKCYSQGRQRLGYAFLKDRTDFFTATAKKMLHIAPEPCFEQKFEKLYGTNYITADLYTATVKVKMDIMNIQYEDETFDIIYCSHVLEHVSDDRKAIGEFFRVLKKGGWAILNVPVVRNDKTIEDLSIIDPKEREKFFGQDDHVRAYGTDYVDRLRDAGFSVDVVHAKDMLNDFDIERMELNYNSACLETYFCKKN